MALGRRVRTVTGGVAALARAGVVRPLPLQVLRAILVALYRYGPGPATLFAIAAARWPNRAMLVDEQGPLSYGELDCRANAFADRLATEHDVGPGRCVGIMCRNGRGFAIALDAVAKVGADALLLNTDLSAYGLTKILGQLSVSAVVTEPEFDERFYDSGHFGPVLTDTGAPPVDAAPRPRLRRPGKLMLLTSGTTGIPKCVARTPGPLDYLGIAGTVLRRMRLDTRSTRIVVSIPLFHGFGLGILLVDTLLGGTLITRRRCTPTQILRDVEAHRATVVTAVPTMLRRILAVPQEDRLDVDLSTLRCVVSGGASLTPSLATEFMDTFGDKLFNGFGSAEVGIGAIGTPADLRAMPGTVGTAVFGTTIRVLGPAGEQLAANRVGRLFFTGEQNFAGYVGGESFVALGDAVSTGDMGHVDVAGRVFVDGREDDMIVTATGDMLFPQEVEDVLARHPDVTDYAVISVSDRTAGKRFAAFVTFADDSETTESDIRTFLDEHLSPARRPRDVHVLDRILRNATGKVQRSELSTPSATLLE